MGRKLRNFGVAVLSIAAFMTLINVVPPVKSMSRLKPWIKKLTTPARMITNEIPMQIHFDLITLSIVFAPFHWCTVKFRVFNVKSDKWF